MYQYHQKRKYTYQERQAALDWLKAKVADRVPYAKGPFRLTKDEVAKVEVPNDEEDWYYKREVLQGLVDFLKMVYYNWVDDWDWVGDRSYNFLGGHDLVDLYYWPEKYKRTVWLYDPDEGLPECAHHFDDDYTFEDIITILFYGQEYTKELTNPNLGGDGFDCIIWFEYSIFKSCWMAGRKNKEHLDAIIDSAACDYRFPERPEPLPEPDPEHPIDPFNDDCPF